MKNNKRKFLGVFLFLFALAGVVGYGAYSYYYTTGSAHSDEQSIHVASFSPEFYSGFIHGNTGSISLSCPSTSGGAEYVDCTGTLEVRNNGELDITVSVSDYSVSTSGEGNISGDYNTPTFEWSNSTVSGFSSTTLYITLPVYVNNGTNHGANGSDAEYIEYAVSGGDLGVTMDLTITATQVH